LIKQKYQCLKFLLVDKHQRFTTFIRPTTSITLEHLSSNAENSFANTIKVADYFF